MSTIPSRRRYVGYQRQTGRGLAEQSTLMTPSRRSILELQLLPRKMVRSATKEPAPAADSAWLVFIEGRRAASRLVVSHFRHATQGNVSLANTQPFARGQMHVFAHNGRLDGIEDRCPGQWKRFQPVGQTDSEIAFVLMERQGLS